MKRSQAALFDGIMFLLFASISVAMVFVFLNEYGKAQDATLRSGYVLAYVQQVGKALFFLHAKTLRFVADPNVPGMKNEACWYDPESGVAAGQCNGATQGHPYSDLQVRGKGCDVLGDFELSTVADLLKKDLGDGDDESKSCLDDRFGSVPGTYPGACKQKAGNPRWNSVATIPGKTALRCALKELLKPMQTAGFKYFVDVRGERKDGPNLRVIPQEFADASSLGSGPNAGKGFRISNHWKATQDNWDSCEDVVSKGKVDNLLTVSIPFRVNRETTLENMMNLVLRVCVWPSKAGR